MPDIPSFSDFLSTSKASFSLDDLTSRIKQLGFDVASTTEGRHNVGSLHPLGRAADVRITNKSPKDISRLISTMSAAGYHVIDERKRLPNEKVWGGPHIHIDFGGRVRAVEGNAPSFSQFEKQIPSFSEFTKEKPKSTDSKFGGVSGEAEGAKPSGEASAGGGASLTKGKTQARFERILQSWGPKTRWVLDAVSSGAADVANKTAGIDILSPAVALTNYAGKKLTGVSPREDLALNAREVHEAVRNVDTKAGGRSWLSQKLQDVTAGTVASGPELVLTMLGIPAWMAFGMGGAADARGQGGDFRKIVTEAAKGAAIGKLWELSPATKAGLIKSIGQKMASVGIGTLGVEMVSKAKYGMPAVMLLDAIRGDKSARQGLGESAESAVTMGVTAGAGELLSGVREKSKAKPTEAPTTEPDLRKLSVFPEFEQELRLRADRDAKFKMTPEERAKFVAERKAKDESTQLTQFPPVDSPERIAERARQQREKSEAAPVETPTESKFKGQEGAASINVISGGALSKLNTIRQTVSTLAKTRGVREALAYSRDAGDNGAAIFANRMRNDVVGQLRQSLKSVPKEAGDALSFVVESQGDPSQLDAMRQKIATSTKAAPGWKKRALTAIDYAQKNWDSLQPAAKRYEEITTQQVASENASGIDTLKRSGYVMHAQDIEGAPVGLLASSGTGEATGFKKVRVHETFADSIAAGVNPKSLNALDLLSTRLNNGQRLINRRAWTQDLKSISDPKSNAPVAVDPVVTKRADGSSYQEAPQGYTLESAGLGGQQIAVMKGYEGIYGALTDPSWFSRNAATRGFMQANAAGKSISLMMDTFHLGRLALWESLIKSLGVKTFKAPFPSYRRGLTLLDTTPAEINRMAASGEIPQKWTNDLLESKRRVDLLVDNGYNVGSISDSLHQDLIHSLPVIGNFNKWLFKEFQRGAMTEVGLLEYDRISRARPEMSEAERARAVAKDLNTRFGNLGRQGIFKSRTGQDLARSLALAPQWNEGLIRSELGAVIQGGKFIGDLAQGKKLYSGVLLRSVGGMAVAQFVANQLINLYTRGYPTWQNPEEGFGAKVSAWIPDKIGGGPGLFLHPLALAAETTHLLMKGFEKTGEFAAALNDYARSRASSAMRPVLTFVTRRDFLGRSLKPGTVWWETVKSAVPSPIPSSALYDAGKQVVTGKNQEPYPGAYQRQLLSSFGVKTEAAPSGEQRVRRLAAAFNTAHGATKQGEFYESPYQPLLQSMSPEALTELRKTKSKQQILSYFEKRIDHPLTGSAARETQFLKSLNPEQRGQYFAAKGKRRQQLQQVRKLLAASK